jgi:uncharacterized repeat protein (TIGR03837 family)
MNKQHTWDIFCRVIDNYGDIGVCWRLARQLAGELNQSVRLWVDDLESLQRIWPTATASLRQHVSGVEVRHWAAEFPLDIQPAQIVIEAFACDIPESYLGRMASMKTLGRAPLWIDLEYLSAESWVEGCHLMTSIHPATGLRKRFFFPGFTTGTGGLLREHALPEQQHTFNKTAFFDGINVEIQPDKLLVSLFAYENAAIKSLFEHWSQSSQGIHCLVPNGKILTSIDALLPEPLIPGSPQALGNLRLEAIPFLTQIQYDQLLWACDINFVRGEDSLVRAQWAGKPFVWHIYPQEEQAHMTKLDAFMDVFTAFGDADFDRNLRNFWRSWNQEQDIGSSWKHLADQLPAWQTVCRKWCESLTLQQDLASQLMRLATACEAEKTTTEKPQSPV